MRVNYMSENEEQIQEEGTNKNAQGKRPIEEVSDDEMRYFRKNVLQLPHQE
jgi:hypothetical protein